MKSIWEQTTGCKEFGRLTEDIKTDVLIIGGGLAGILCAYKLSKAGVSCIIAESGRILGRTTANTTAKITYQHGLIYSRLIKKYGKDFARGYLNANKKALNEYKALCRDIECDLVEAPAFVYSRTGCAALEEELKAYEALGEQAHLCEDVPLPFEAACALKVDGQAAFNPLKFAYALAQDLKIYENTKVSELIGCVAKTAGGSISAKKIVVATHFPIINKHGGYFLKMHQERSYVIALKGARSPNGMYIDAVKGGLSFRQYKDCLLLGGGAHRTGKSTSGWSMLEEFAKKHYTGYEIAAKWATQDCITLDGAPYVGQYSSRTPDLYVITGFNKWGMTSAMAGAELISALITGKETPYSEIFSPSRSIIHPALFKNVFASALGLITPTVPRCPHLGCALKHNKYEHSWDCGCHGSRFADDGALLDGPATDGIKGRKK